MSKTSLSSAKQIFFGSVLLHERRGTACTDKARCSGLALMLTSVWQSGAYPEWSTTMTTATKQKITGTETKKTETSKMMRIQVSTLNGGDWEVRNCDIQVCLSPGYKKHNVRQYLEDSGWYPQKAKGVRNRRMIYEGHCPPEVWDRLASLQAENIRERERENERTSEEWRPQLFRFIHGERLRVLIGQVDALKRIGIVCRQHVDPVSFHTHILLEFVRGPYSRDEWMVDAMMASLFS